MDFKIALKKTWSFIWNDNSLLSWIVNIILAFLIVKFLLYPGLGLIMQTNHPIVAVVSGSMEHNGNFDDWWEENRQWYEEHGFTKEQFSSFSMSNGFNKGDIIFLIGTNNIRVGDVIVFQGNSKNPIIHRAVNRYAEEGKIFYTTKGDANSGSSQELGEIKIPEERLIGRSIFRIPYLGWIKIIFTELTGV